MTTTMSQRSIPRTMASGLGLAMTTGGRGWAASLNVGSLNCGESHTWHVRDAVCACLCRSLR